MSGILFDNWNLEEVSYMQYHSKERGKEIYRPNMAYADLLNAYMLWDEIYYLADLQYSLYWMTYPMMQEWKEILHPIEISKETYEQYMKRAKEIYQSCYGETKEVIAKGVIQYLMLADTFDLPYLPMKYRAEFIERTGLEHLYKDMQLANLYREANRNAILTKVDKNIEEMIHDFQNIPLDKRSFRYPVLTDMIIENANCPENYLEVAKEIRAEKDLKRFRKDMGKIEEAIKHGKWGPMREYVNEVNEIIQNLGRKEKKHINFYITATIGIIPKIEIHLEADMEKDIKWKKKKYDMTFIRKAVNNRLYK